MLQIFGVLMTVKTFKKGEQIFKDGDKISHLIVVQKGGVNLCLIRGKKNFDIQQLGANQIIGEQVFLGIATHATSAVATTNDTQILEVPLEQLKSQYDQSPQMVKLAVKSLSERLRYATNEMKSHRLETDAAPCPEDQVAKAFASLYHTLNHKGDKKSRPGMIILDWNMLKQYAQRLFIESPKRIEQTINVFVKLKLAQYEIGKNPDNPEGPDEIQKVDFFELSCIENFFEFYQYYYFKTGKSEFLKVDETCFHLLNCFNILADKLTVDKQGIVGIEFNELTEYCKNELSIQINNTHFDRLEQKGIYCKRKTEGSKVVLQFDKNEFKQMLYNWRILREIEKWNEKGFVDLNEKEEKLKKNNQGPSCPQCGVGVQAQAKFCHECGTQLQTKAA